MKIAIISGDDLTGDDPRRLAAALGARGHVVTCYVRRPGDAATGAEQRIVSADVGPVDAASASEVLPYVGDWAAALGRAWSSEQPDIVHAYGWLGGLAAQLAARRRGMPTVQSFQGLAAAGQPRPANAPDRLDERGRIEPLLARSATWVTGESTADVDALARWRHSRARACVLSSGVDVERFSPVGPAAARTDLHRIVCLAPNPLPDHGFDIAIRALPRLAGTEIVLAETAAGNPAHDNARAQLGRLAAGLGIAERVRFAGPVGEDELPPLLRSADLVACTPRRSPRPTAVLQAMACGVAVVALPVGALTDAVIDNVTGIVLSPERRGELASAMRSLLAQSFHCESMGAAGRSRALSRFTWDRVALDALNVYQQIGARRPSPRVLQSAGIP